MLAIHPLSEILKKRLAWNQARIEFLSQFLIALLCKESVNLFKIAKAFQGSSQIESHYRRINRFFADYELDYHQLCQFVISLFDLPSTWLLSIDRTNWKFGKLNINILMLSVCYQGMAIPLIWSFLDKRGNSNTSERIELMEKFLLWFGLERIECLVADREFIGSTWLQWLQQQHIPYCIRVKKNHKIKAKSTQEFPIYRLFSGLKHKEYSILNQPKELMKVKVRVIGLKIEGQWLILITNSDPENALKRYKDRWQIETLFGCLKTRGFNLEDTHLNQHERINKLLALVVIAFAWAYRIGVWKNQCKPIRIKKHGRPAKSLFRYGMDFLSNLIFSSLYRKNEWKLALQFLSST